MRNQIVRKMTESRVLFIFMAALLLLYPFFNSYSFAGEIVIPPISSKAHLQTNGPLGELDNGDWWSNVSGGNQPHIFLIYVPPAVAADFMIQLDLFDPECYQTDGEMDELKGRSWDPTTFRILAPDGSTVITEQTFPPSASTSQQWISFASFTRGQYGAGIYQLTSSTVGDDENTFRIRIREADPDQIAESGDEIHISILKSTFQFYENGCVDMYYYVPQLPAIYLANFDLELDGSVTHFSPTGATSAGTVSGDGIWNNSESSSLPPPSGDYIEFPENGWWKTQICATSYNQFIFYPSMAYFINELPSTPQLDITITDGVDQVVKNQNVQYAMVVTNNGNGPAQQIVLTVVLSTGLTVQTFGHGGALLAPNQLSWPLSLIRPGESVSLTFDATVTSAAPAAVVAMAQASYQDLLFNNYLSSQAIDIDQLAVRGVIAGTVWHDPNENGLLESGENGMANISLSLINSSGQIIATTTTDANGQYTFVDIPIGSYRVQVDMGTLPPDWGPTTNNEQQWFLITDQGESYLDVNLGFNNLETPVELTSFTAIASVGLITLKWTTQSETENVGFNVYRSEQPDGVYQRLNRSIIRGAGNSQSKNNYSYEDRDIAPAKTYYYKLSDISYAGVETMHGPISVTSLMQPTEYKLEQNYPNPFNAETIIPIQLSESGETKVIIFNLLGQEVRRLVDQTLPAGRHLLHWDGKDQMGQLVPAGIYFYQLSVNGFTQMRKMQYVR